MVLHLFVGWPFKLFIHLAVGSSHLAFFIKVAWGLVLVPIVKLLQANRNEPLDLTGGYANNPFLSDGFDAFCARSSQCCYLVSDDSLPGNRTGKLSGRPCLKA